MTGRRRSTLTQRIVGAQVLVIAAMSVTVVVAAGLVGPAVFDRHMREAGHDSPMVLAHAQEAFRSAGLAAMAAGLVIAVLGALAAAVLLTRGIGRGLDALAEGADRVASGRYDEPVSLPPSARELDHVAGAFNAMADQIAHTESTRRRMLTDLAHEMRTPLAALDVTLEGVEDGVVPLDATTTATLRAQTARLTRLASDIRDVSAAEEGRLDLQRERVSVGTLVDSATGAARAAYVAAGVSLASDVEDPGATVDADPARLGQVLDNLLRNARQHTPEGGYVVVRSRVEDTVVVVEVTDDGAGIGAEHLPHVFERFYRADPGRHRDATSGTGVGLAIARAIVTAHGGTLEARSEGPDRGTTLTLTLPLA